MKGKREDLQEGTEERCQDRISKPQVDVKSRLQKKKRPRQKPKEAILEHWIHWLQEEWTKKAKEQEVSKTEQLEQEEESRVFWVQEIQVEV